MKSNANLCINRSVGGLEFNEIEGYFVLEITDVLGENAQVGDEVFQ